MQNTHSLKIDDGKIRIAVNDDPDRVIAFNPNDINFIKRLYQMIGDFEELEQKSKSKIAKIEKKLGSTKNDVLAAKDAIDMWDEIFDALDAALVELFGEGADKKITGGVRNQSVYEQFIDGITPFIQQARSEILEKYAHPAYKKKGKK